MSRKNNLYLGKAGQLVAMSYFLMRGWNVATPEVDVGDDLFVIEDAKGIFYRVQVKTANAAAHLNSYSAQFKVPLRQLQKAIDPEVYYVFIVSRNHQWSDKLIIPRNVLFELYTDSAVGTVADKSLIVYFSFEINKITQKTKVICSDVDVTKYLDNFDDFPVIQH